MRISDWSSDVCSSDLVERMARTGRLVGRSGEAAQRRRRFLVEPVIEALRRRGCRYLPAETLGDRNRSEEHTSELQSLMRISYAVFCLKKKKENTQPTAHI